MFLDGRHRLISYHDTWISIDPVRGCPYQCAYCVLQYGGTTGIPPQTVATPAKCVEELLSYPLFVFGYTPLAVGNETDMLHSGNVDCLVALLEEMRCAHITNPVVLITKAPLTDAVLNRIRAVGLKEVVFFLSYSGLGKDYEPNFSDEQLRENFTLVKKHGFPVVHWWRPLLTENTTQQAVERMLSFASGVADASIFVGLKLHPELNRILLADAVVKMPEEMRLQCGEWLPDDTVRRIYATARHLCPAYPLYRHASCALAKVRKAPNHTATVFRADICPASHCPAMQREVCEQTRRPPSPERILSVIKTLGRPLDVALHPDSIEINGEISQEEFSYLLHRLNFPLRVRAVHLQNLYRGSILDGQHCIADAENNPHIPR